MKQCKECGCDFQPKNQKGQFCSKICKQKDYRKKVAAKIEYLMTHGPGTALPPMGRSINIENISEAKVPTELTLHEQIKAIESEKMPDYIYSEQGKVFWQQGQRKKIMDLKNKLKNQ